MKKEERGKEGSPIQSMPQPQLPLDSQVPLSGSPLPHSLLTSLCSFARQGGRGSRRRVILSTPIAESSVTIDGVTVVIDSGLRRSPVYDTQTGRSGYQQGGEGGLEGSGSLKGRPHDPVALDVCADKCGQSCSYAPFFCVGPSVWTQV